MSERVFFFCFFNFFKNVGIISNYIEIQMNGPEVDRTGPPLSQNLGAIGLEISYGAASKVRAHNLGFGKRTP